MGKTWKRLLAAGLAFNMFSFVQLPEIARAEAAQAAPFTMEASGTDGTEDWGKLKIDMGDPETDNNDGYRGTPLGNGLFGAKQNGGVSEDVFVLNHSTFWSGDPAYREALRNGEGGYGDSQKVRSESYHKLVDTLKQAYREGISRGERDALMYSIPDITSGMWEADASAAFLSAGRMKLGFSGLDGTADYSRILDMDEATSVVTFQKGAVKIENEK